jgi:hypothetical protein
MKDSKRNGHQQKTILAIHHDASVLVLLKGILANKYRVLLAADAGTAERLALLEAVPIDLVLMGRNTRGARKSRDLQRRLVAIRPDLAFMSMIGSAEDPVIKIRIVGMPQARRSDDFIDQIRWTLAYRAVNRATASTDVHLHSRQKPSKNAGVPQVALAGATS